MRNIFMITCVSESTRKMSSERIVTVLLGHKKRKLRVVTVLLWLVRELELQATRLQKSVFEL